MGLRTGGGKWDRFESERVGDRGASGGNMGARLVLVGMKESRESFFVKGTLLSTGRGEVSGLESVSSRLSADTR